MAQHYSSRSSKVRTNARRSSGRSACPPSATEITDIIPFDEFGRLDDLDFRESTTFDSEARVLHAPELDDLCDADDLGPVVLAAPIQTHPEPDVRPTRREWDDADRAFPRRGQHRTPSTANTARPINPSGRPRQACHTTTAIANPTTTSAGQASIGEVTRGRSYVITSGQGQTASRAYKSSTVACVSHQVVAG